MKHTKMIIPISEVFFSLQGEGRNTGKPSIFVRFWGCNLQCSWCDSKYAWQDTADKKNFNITELANEIRKYPCKHIVFTGGEPSLFENIIEDLMSQLFFSGYTYEIETNGTRPLRLTYTQVNVSYKLSSSGNKPYPLQALGESYDYKFVIDSEDDRKEMEMIIALYNLKNIYIMPLGVKSETQNRQDLAQYCMEKGYTYCQRLHILLFNGKRGV